MSEMIVDLDKPAKKPRKPREPRCKHCGFKAEEHVPLSGHAFEAKEKKAPAVRRDHDAYGTVDDLAEAIVNRIAEIHWVPEDEAILEPTAGEGPFIRACRKVFGASPKIGAVDIQWECREKCLEAGANVFVGRDILTVEPELLARFSLLISNPPFKIAAQVIDHLHAGAPRAFHFYLLPVSFWGGTSEDVVKGVKVTPRDPAFAKRNPVTYFAPIWPRPSFTGDGKTDRMEYGLFGFGGAISSVMDGRRIGDPIIWDPRRYGLAEPRPTVLAGLEGVLP